MTSFESRRRAPRGAAVFAATAASAALLAAILAGASAQEPGAADGIALEKVEATEKEDGSRAIVVAGTASVPNGIRVQVGIVYAGKTGHVTQTEVIGERFAFEIPIEGKVIPDDYEVQVALAAQQPKRATRGLDPEKRRALTEQPTVRKLRLGPPDGDTKKAVDDARAHVADLLAETRAIFADMLRVDQTISNQLRAVKAREDEEARATGRKPRKTFEAIQPKALESLRGGWMKAHAAYVDGRFATLELRLAEHRKLQFMHPLPDAVETLEALLVALEKWLSATTIEVHEGLGLAPPAKSAGRRIERGVLLAKINDTSLLVYKHLGATAQPWLGEGAAEASAERGRVIDDGETYVSYARQFRVSRPGAEWEFDAEMRGRKPSLQVLIKPGADAPEGTIIAVEIDEYPSASSFDELAERAWGDAPKKIPGYKEIATRPLELDDASVGGKRRGIERTFSTQPGKDADGPAFWVRHYELFGKDHTRIYRVVCVAPLGSEGGLKAAFEKSCASLRVLDGDQGGEK